MPILKDIVKIQTGLYLQSDKYGNAVYLQVKSFDEGGKIKTNLQPEVVITERLSHHLLEAGDILFAAKGDKNFAAVYKNEYLAAAASSSFFVLKHPINFLPEYLAWFLNHPFNQKKLKAEAKGSSIASLSMETLGNIEVELVDLPKQRLVSQLSELRKKEKRLRAEITFLKDQIIDTQLSKNFIKGTRWKTR